MWSLLSCLFQPDCDTAACSYDGLDCIRGSDPYSNCPSAVECKLAYMNGRCDVTCNRLECLYDGFECIPPKGECPKKADCEADVEDGLCQPDCLTVECPYDFQDCRLSSSRNLVSCIECGHVRTGDYGTVSVCS